MALSQATRDKLKAAFPKGGHAACDDLPIAMPHADRVPVRGSVHIATGRVISRNEINQRFDKAFSR